MTCNHIDPTTWRKVRGEDGKERMYCSGCGAFKGYVVQKEPARPGKVK